MKTLKMRCCVPFCETTAETVSESMGITFYEFPSEEHLRAAWLRALGKQGSLPDSAMVCSQHFLNDDFCATQSGSRQIQTGAIPTTVQVCMICLDTRSKLLLMSKYKLDEAYRHLVGQPLCDQGNLRQTLCVQCAQRLVNFNKFRDKSLRAQCLMMELVEQHEIITIKHIKSINRVTHQLESDIVKTMLEPNHCDVYIQSDADTQTELDAIAVKCEESHDSMSVDGDHTQNMPVREDDNNADSFNGHSIAYKEEYLSNGSHPTEIKDPLLTTSSISKEKVVEKVAPIKQEISFACTTCSMEFADEDLYVKHTLMHMEDMVSPDDHSVPHSSHTSVAPLPVRLATTQEIEEHLTNTNRKQEAFGNNETIVEDLRQSKITILQPDQLLAELNNSINLHTTMGNELLNNELTDTDYRKIEKKTSQDIIGNCFDQKHYICDVCQKEFKRKSVLVTHIQSHTYVKTYKLDQYKCNKNKTSLLKHNNTHTDVKPLACTCENQCVKKCHLGRQINSRNVKNPFACKLCDYKCAKKCALVAHMITHSGIKRFTCDLCNGKFTRKGGLQRHMRTHTGEKPYSCKLCDYKCTVNSGIARHMMMHTGEKPYACTVCKYRCTEKSNLVRHMYIHMGIKPFACELCKYKTTEKSTLKRHMRTHTGEMPFACKLCGYKCAYSSVLVNHMKTHSKVRPPRRDKKRKQN